MSRSRLVLLLFILPLALCAPLSATAVCTPGDTTLCLGGTDCASGEDHLCLGGDRFRVSVEWRDAAGNSGTAGVVPLQTRDSGLFWFFAPDNWELFVKVLNGCGLNDRF